MKDRLNSQRTVRVLGLLIVLACSAPGGVSAEAPRRLWVVQRPAGVVEYDLATFKVIRTVEAPERIFFHPGLLSINPSGQMLYRDQDGMWFWDGSKAKAMRARDTIVAGDSAGVPTRITVVQDVSLSVDGDRLYWFEQRFEQTRNSDGHQGSQRVEYRVWSTDLAGAGADTIIHIPGGEWCLCTTGACSETCGEWQPWAPRGLIGGLLALTTGVRGQLLPRYGPTRLYRESPGAWRYEEMAGTLPVLLDVSEDGGVVIGTEPDDGCCGWMNVNSDRMVLLAHGSRFVLYDEFPRFENQNYDVSFYVSGARLSPDRTAVAYTLEATNDGRPFRLSSEGRPDVADSMRIARAAEALPAVEVLALGEHPGPPVPISRGALVGWLSDTEILLAKDGRLAVFDVQGELLRHSGVPVSTPAAVFLR